ncbi:hypothetical protein DPMN_017681 [Dreissena polymorpha]|uniref:Uncharacterized protein n=1 Tax=Dreissena polymorpha TaxID=45954 RepID=A0A9D4S5N8_DREPO|nr:hypothetical protein DPMN_017681 [Dreissena polymorpha]
MDHETRFIMSGHKPRHETWSNIKRRNVNARVFTNQIWTDGQRTKTNPKTSPEQSAIFQLVQEINKTNTSRVFTSFFLLYKFKKTGTIFQLNSRIKETNDLTKFHEHWTKKKKNAPPIGGHVFSPIWTILELVRHINKTNVLINFHDEWAKIVTSRVFTRKTAPPTGGHLHEDWALNVTSTDFKLDRDFIGTNLLNKFHEGRTINVASRVFTNKCGRTDDGQRPVTKAHLSNQVS